MAANQTLMLDMICTEVIPGGDKHVALGHINPTWDCTDVAAQIAADETVRSLKLKASAADETHASVLRSLPDILRNPSIERLDITLEGQKWQLIDDAAHAIAASRLQTVVADLDCSGSDICDFVAYACRDNAYLRRVHIPFVFTLVALERLYRDLYENNTTLEELVFTGVPYGADTTEWPYVAIRSVLKRNRDTRRAVQ